MNIKQLVLASSLIAPFALLPTVSVNAAPLVSIGDNVDVFFNGSSSVRWVSNVFREENDKVDDFMLTLSPGFEINVGRGVSNADFSIITRYDILRYDDLSHLNTELFHIQAVGSYQAARLNVNGAVSFDEEQSTAGNEQVQGRDDLIESDNVRARLMGEYRFSPKFSFGAGVRYHERKYTTFEEILADRKTTSFPLDVFYELTPKVDLSGGYTYTYTDVDSTDTRPSYDIDSHFFNVGARGNLLPKLTGFFKVGYRTRSTSGLANDTNTGMLGLDADLTYLATPKVTTRLALSRDFGVGGEGATTENTSVDLTARYAINSYFSSSANLGYTLRDYDSNRKDHQYIAGLRLAYTPNQYWQFSTGYTYSNNDSNLDNRSYTNHTIDLSASLRY